MFRFHIGAILLVANSICRQCVHAFNVNAKNSGRLVATDEGSFLETSRHLLRGSASSQDSKATVSDPDTLDNSKETFSEEVEDMISDTERALSEVDPKSMVSDAVSNVLPAATLIKDIDLSKISAASAKELEELYGRLNKIDPDIIQQIRDKAPALLHELHRRGGRIHHMNYPHMHVVNHKVVKNAPTVSSKTAELFTKQPLFFADDHVVLALVSLCLVGMSSLYNMPKKGGSRTAVCHDAHGFDHGSGPPGQKLSVWDGTITTFSSILGMGFLSLPYAVALAGWIGGLLITFFTACAGYTAHLLVWALQQQVDMATKHGRRPAMPSWGFLLGSVFGLKAERAVNVFLVVELWGYALSSTVAIAMNLNQLVDEISVSAAIGLTVLVQYVLLLIPIKVLTRINVLCNFSFIACACMFIVTGWMLPAKPAASDFRFVKPEGVLAACGIIVFTGCGHSLYPALQQRMEEPSKYPVCLRRAYFGACATYICFALPGYYFFGNSSQPSAVSNIGVDLNLVPLPNLGWMNYVAAFSIVMKLSGTQPLLLAPLNSTIEDMLQDWMPRTVSATLVAPAVLTISAVVAIHFAHQMASLLSLVGSVFCMNIAFVLPVVCYWKLNRQSVSGGQRSLFIGLISMGIIFAVLGLITALDP